MVATPPNRRRRRRRRRRRSPPRSASAAAAATSGETYIIEAGDTPLAIAEETGVDYDALLEANPDLEANALAVGEELVLP